MKWLEIYDNAWVVISYPPTVHQSNMSANNCFFPWFSCKSTTHISPYRAIQVLRYWWNFPKSNMIQCASRAHPSVSTTRLAPKHPQRCVGVLLGKNRWVASTYSFHLDKETKKSLHDFACPVWQDGKFGKHAIYNKLVGQDYPDGMHVGSKRSTSIFIPSRDSKGSRLGTRGRGTSSRQRVQQQWKPKPWRASHLAWCGNLRFASIFNKG